MCNVLMMILNCFFFLSNNANRTDGLPSLILELDLSLRIDKSMQLAREIGYL